MTSIGAALHAATLRLRAVSDTGRLDAELLLAHVLGISRTRLLASLPDLLPVESADAFWTLIARRTDLEPVAYLVGEREFYGLRLRVDPRVLVPRPETEVLVARALEIMAGDPKQDGWRVADIGTGSGAIAVAVAANAPEAHVFAVDLSCSALDVARLNVERYGLGDKISLLHGDGLKPLPGPVDLLLSNPPYTILDEVDENVRRHEPHLALDGGEDGLAVIRELFTDAPRYLEGGAMLIELAIWQGSTATALAREAFPNAVVRLHRDLTGRERVLEINLMHETTRAGFRVD